MKRRTSPPRQPLRHRRLGHDRRGNVALMAALLALPLIGMIGMAVDFAMYSQTNSALIAAARAGVLNAVKVAAAGAAAGSSSYVQDGQNAGMKWFIAQSGKTGLTVSNLSSSVTVASGPTITATLKGTAQVPSIFGAIFGVKTYSIAIATQAQQSVAPYAEVVMLMDNSPSMAIGAGATDIATLMQNSPCDPSMQFTSTTGTSWTYANIVGNRYDVYECSNGGTYDGQNSPWGAPACPVSNGNSTYTYQYGSRTYTATNPNPSNPGYYGSNFTCPGKAYGHTIYPGPPCAFACHSDSTKQAGLGNDLYAMARKLGVTMRMDLLKNAVQQVITSMQTRDPNGTALSLGVYAFATGLYQVYPSSAEAGSDWSAASAAVGFPPTAGSYTESGLQPAVAEITSASNPVNNKTNYTESMVSLASTVTSAGSGTTAAAPRKALILMTDGMDDEAVSGFRGAMPGSYCQLFKNMGYKVYVLYTPYYPLMEETYLSTLMSIVEGTGTNSITYNLQQCSSSTGASDLSTYFVQASSDQASVTAALQGFLNSALATPALYTQ